MATDQTDLPLRDFGSIQKRQTPFWDHTNLRKAPLSLFFFFRCAIILLFFQKAAGHCLRGWKTYKSVKKIGERVCCELGCWGGWISITFVIPPHLSSLFLSHPLHSMWHSFISQVRLASPSPMSAVPVTTNLGMSWHSWWVSAGHRRQAGCYVRPLLCTAEAGDSQHNQTNDPWRLCPSGREK